MPVGLVGGEPLGAGREVGDPAQRAGGDGVGVEHDEVGGEALGRTTPRSAKPNRSACTWVSLWTASSR